MCKCCMCAIIMYCLFQFRCMCSLICVHVFSPLSCAYIICYHRLELWPGFITSILQYESNVMLCADISHKIIRMDTVLDLFYDIHSQNSRNFHEACVRAIVGEIVLTRFRISLVMCNHYSHTYQCYNRYNNRTYRVDDIDWTKNPSSTFTLADGTETNFKEYYKKVLCTCTDVYPNVTFLRVF